MATPPRQPVFKISYELARREWTLEAACLPFPVRFAEGRRGEVGLIGAIDTAMFAGRETGGMLEIRFVDEIHCLWFEGSVHKPQAFLEPCR